MSSMFVVALPYIAGSTAVVLFGKAISLSRHTVAKTVGTALAIFGTLSAAGTVYSLLRASTVRDFEVRFWKLTTLALAITGLGIAMITMRNVLDH